MNIFILAIEKSWSLNLFRSLFAFLDYLIYTVISWLFRTMFQLANFELAGFYEPIQERVYVILGIFMLFKVTVSLISYLVNPDKITDKEQGVGKVVTRIITVLVMLIFLPNAFALMTELQNKLIPVVPKIIIGTSFQQGTESDNAEKVGTTMSIALINNFAPAERIDNDPTQFLCSNAHDFSSLADFVANVNIGCEPNTSVYAYGYIPVLSTLVGVLMCYVVISLCISIAIRAFKLIILRMLAPVPIISYIDPKSSKDGMFNTWIKTFITTWAELFIYLGLIYFIVYMIHFLLAGNAWQGFFNGVNIVNPLEAGLFLAFIFIGLLFFARQAPKFIFDALGIKTKGNFVRMLGMGAAALGMAGSTAASFRARNAYDKDQGNDPHLLRNFGASLFSGLASGEAAGSAIVSADKPTLMTGYDAMSKNNATMLSRVNSGSTLGGRIGALGQTLVFGETTADINDRKIKNLKAGKTALETVKSRVSSEMVKKDWTYGNLGIASDINGDEISGVNYKSFMASLESSKAQGLDTVTFQDINGDWHEIYMRDAEMQKGFLLKNNESNYIEQHVNGTVAPDDIDKVLISNIENAEKYNPGIHITNRNSVNENIDSIGLQIQDVERENARHTANRRGQGNNGN